MEKPKISIFTISMSAGGAEKVISLLLRKLPSDFEVHLVLLFNDIHFDIPENVKVKAFYPAHALKHKGVFGKAMISLKCIGKYRSYIKKNKISTSISFLAQPNLINSIIALRTKNVRTIISERCNPTTMYDINKLSKLIAKIAYPLLYNRNDLLFSNSVYINKDLKKNFGVRLPMHVVYNPVEISSKKPSRFSNKADSAFKLITVGSNTVWKDQMLILKAMLTLKSDCSLSILGSGPLSEDLKSFAEQNNLSERVDLPGRVSDVNQRLAKHHCFILSSITEGFPNALLEGMAAGLPAISTNCVSGPLEILNDNEAVNIEKGEFYCAKYGILINVNDDIALVKAIEYLRTHEDERERYAKLSHERMKEFSLSSIYDKLKKLITED